MAEVWRGYDRRLGRAVAVKVLRSDLASDDVFVERLRREARSVARLNHPSIVAIYDAGGDQVDGVLLPYLVMEYVDGRPLSHVLGDGQRLTTERALQVTMAILEALEFSHRAGFVHRDIKPANIMLTADDGVKVMDFGIARALAEASAELTKTAQVLGTARYLSPEQATGGAVDGRSDVYSTGCLLYELLAGRPPYTAETAMGVIGLHVQADVPLARDADWDVPAALSAIAARAMAKDPADRFQSAAEMREALAAYVDPAAPVVAAPAAAVARRRGPAVLYGLAAAGVVLAIAGGSYLLTDRTAPVSDPRPANTSGADPADGAAPADPGTQGDEVSQSGDTEGSGNNRPPGPRPDASTSVTPGSTPAPGPTPTAAVPPPPGETSEPEPSTSPDPSPSPTDSDSPSPSPEPSESPEPSDSPSPSVEPSPTPTETDPPEPTNPTPTEPSTSTSPDATPTGESDRQA